MGRETPIRVAWSAVPIIGLTDRIAFRRWRWSLVAEETVMGVLTVMWLSRARGILVISSSRPPRTSAMTGSLGEVILFIPVRCLVITFVMGDCIEARLSRARS